MNFDWTKRATTKKNLFNIPKIRFTFYIIFYYLEEMSYFERNFSKKKHCQSFAFHFIRKKIWLNKNIFKHLYKDQNRQFNKSEFLRNHLPSLSNVLSFIFDQESTTIYENNNLWKFFLIKCWDIKCFIIFIFFLNFRFIHSIHKDERKLFCYRT